MADLITVEAARDDGRVALWEKDPAHPDGEVFIASGTGRHEVARTPAVLRALAEGRLIEHPKFIGPPVAATPSPIVPAPGQKGKGPKQAKAEQPEPPVEEGAA